MEILVLYSEYSKKCKDFIERLDSDPVIDSKKLHKLCIDCPAIREAILKQENVIIKKVPSIMTKNNGDIEVFEGKAAFDWLKTFSSQLYEQLARQQEEAEYLAAQREEEIEMRIQQEAEALARQKLEESKAAVTSVSQQQQVNKNVKQQARIIEQDRRQGMNFDDQPKSEFGETHVSQVKSDNSSTTRVSDIVKNMEREREMDEAKIKKQLSSMAS
jgi:hypothetical protein